nr:carotenoid oxygenase family protein [Acidimicrobiia bacterium]
SRFVATAKKRAEDSAGRRIYATFGSRPGGGAVRRLLHPFPRCTANAGVVHHDGRLLALWSGARPYALDAETLATIGPESFGGRLRPWHPFSAAPVRDPATGDLWNVGVRPGLPAVARLYRCPAGAKAEVVARLAVPFAPASFAFGLTATTAVVVIPPAALPRFPVALALGRATALDVLEWRPDEGTLVLLVDRRTGAVRGRARTDAFMPTSLAQAYDDGDDVVVDLCAFPDATVFAATQESMDGEAVTQTYPTLQTLRIRPDGSVERTLRPPLDGAAVVDPAAPGPAARIAGVTVNPAGGYFGLPAVVAAGTANVSWAPPDPHLFAGPPVPIARPGGEPSAWVLTLALNSARARSELRILDGDDLRRPPAAVVALPHVVPFGARGTWVPA